MGFGEPAGGGGGVLRPYPKRKAKTPHFDFFFFFRRTVGMRVGLLVGSAVGSVVGVSVSAPVIVGASEVGAAVGPFVTTVGADVPDGASMQTCGNSEPPLGNSGPQDCPMAVLQQVKGPAAPPFEEQHASSSPHTLLFSPSAQK